jgi:hypothetical protein
MKFSQSILLISTPYIITELQELLMHVICIRLLWGWSVERGKARERMEIDCVKGLGIFKRIKWLRGGKDRRGWRLLLMFFCVISFWEWILPCDLSLKELNG